MLTIVTCGLLIWLPGISCQQVDQESLRVAAAANTQYAMVDIVKAFTEQTGIKAELIISSSGKLSTQITQGAPYDIFVSADMDYPMKLFRNGYASSEPRLYAYGELVIWSNGSIEPSFKGMLQDEVDHIAVANPKTAPYGLVTMAVLSTTGILDAIRDKLVFGENLSQVNQFVASGAAEIGITAKSMMMSSQLKGKGNWSPVSEDLYTPISQGLIIVKRDDGFRDDAVKFFDFMISDTAQKILANNGYKLTPHE